MQIYQQLRLRYCNTWKKLGPIDVPGIVIKVKRKKYPCETSLETMPFLGFEVKRNYNV